MSTETFEIYFHDLIQDAQEELLKSFKTSTSEENWDYNPLCIIEREVEDQ